MNEIPYSWGTAVNVQPMVFGNLNENSGTGVAFTRDPATGEKALFGEYLINAQGEDVVAGIRTPSHISKLAEDMPEVYKQFADIANRLEEHYADMQDMEFTLRTASCICIFRPETAREPLPPPEDRLQTWWTRARSLRTPLFSAWSPSSWTPAPSPV